MPSKYIQENFDRIEPFLDLIKKIEEKYGREMLEITRAISDNLYEMSEELVEELYEEIDEEEIYDAMHLILSYLSDSCLDLHNEALAVIEG